MLKISFYQFIRTTHSDTSRRKLKLPRKGLEMLSSLGRISHVLQLAKQLLVFCVLKIYLTQPATLKKLDFSYPNKGDFSQRTGASKGEAFP